MDQVKIRVVRRSSNPLPAYETADSAGMDLRAELAEAVLLGPGERALVPTGLYLELPTGYEAQVRPRSGLALKSGVTVLNSPGTIDADYRGEVGVVLINLSADSHRIEHGDRIAQLVVAPVTRAAWVEVDELGASQRGSGGFGSTGKD